MIEAIEVLIIAVLFFCVGVALWFMGDDFK